MSRNRYDAAHIDCPVAGKTVIFDVYDEPMICPECHKLLEPRIITEGEFKSFGKDKERIV